MNYKEEIQYFCESCGQIISFEQGMKTESLGGLCQKCLKELIEFEHKEYNYEIN